MTLTLTTFDLVNAALVGALTAALLAAAVVVKMSVKTVNSVKTVKPDC